MARQGGIGRLRMMTALLTSPACAVAVNPDRPCSPPAEQPRSDLHRGRTYSGISQDEHAKVAAAPDRIAAVVEAQPDIATLQPGQHAGPHHDQELVTRISTKAGEDGRPIAGARVQLVRRSGPGSV
ncbi:hypothetical protein [Xanthomonas arboricola]|uniref:hypothetical protein n=1 Tax=Xanthomonas arboricola TaxID=56448 RepID=UPI001EE6D7BE|nr:hypothetical protein [Xanthomonas arboricola]